MSTTQLHRTQASILHSLRYAQSERFSELMQPTNHTSDTFKFHLRKLIKLGYVTRLENGQYQLTQHGKEYANNLNERLRITEKQPKVSALLVITDKTKGGAVRYLLQKRARQPFYEYWNEIHGRVEWGESFEETASRQLKSQTGLDGTFSVHSFRRVRDFDVDTKDLLEDKLFVILKSTSLSGELNNTYDGGYNAWLTIEELRNEEKVFKTTLAIIEELENDMHYQAHDLMYSHEDY